MFLFKVVTVKYRSLALLAKNWFRFTAGFFVRLNVFCILSVCLNRKSMHLFTKKKIYFVLSFVMNMTSKKVSLRGMVYNWTSEIIKF